MSQTSELGAHVGHLGMRGVLVDEAFVEIDRLGDASLVGLALGDAQIREHRVPAVRVVDVHALEDRTDDLAVLPLIEKDERDVVLALRRQLPHADGRGRARAGRATGNDDEKERELETCVHVRPQFLIPQKRRTAPS